MRIRHLNDVKASGSHLNSALRAELASMRQQRVLCTKYIIVGAQHHVVHANNIRRRGKVRSPS